MQSSRDKRIPKAAVTTTTTWINCLVIKQPAGAWLEYFSFLFYFFLLKTSAANEKVLLETGLTPGQRCEGLGFLGEAPQARGREDVH